MFEVTVVVLEEGLPSTCVAPLEIFSSAGQLWEALQGEPGEPFFQVRTVSLDGGPVRSGVPLSVAPDGSIHDIESTDMIIVPAVGADLEPALERNATLLPWLSAWHGRGAGVAGICSGVSLLAEAGLLDERPATTHWALVEELRARYPRVVWRPERFVTEADGVFCSGGVYGSVDLSLYLVEKYCGHETAMRTAKALLLEMPRSWQMGYGALRPRITHGDADIRRVQEWMHENFTGEVKVEELARMAYMSPRHFARRFKAATGETAIGYLHRLRINAARHLLENELQPVWRVSAAVGYRDLTFFRRLFKRYTGVPPRDYRGRFGVERTQSVAVAGAPLGT